MRLARLSTPDGPVSGQLEVGTATSEDGYDGAVLRADGGTYEVGRDGRLLPPCDPSALYCVGRNYADTLEQMNYERPDEPDFFIKPPTSVLGHGQPIQYPGFTDELTYAGELAAVIDRRCRDLAPEQVPEVVRGYTIMNDVDALDQQGRTARKAFDGSAPLGPWLETDIDPTRLEMRTDVAGERRQEASTELMLFDPFEVVAFLSERFTLRPGDVVAFGSPANPGLLEPGDAVEITYEDVGTLRNVVEH
ncbi:fumarylacetoacetate hydrolase family protein [Natronosalvus halobius]|uniref:fumarylacetoacetate hydrolase family protein n=1 Tax=Natronosalvus halobius TaxID=2953746 RepID=UPI00209DF932|nr:fumarylacetoacetate hydrolase family protein [Natronosalvus halobius]USZ71376.1 fumarylacetoacetate hydrolase family protein [Natronosalvus halobius]